MARVIGDHTAAYAKAPVPMVVSMARVLREWCFYSRICNHWVVAKKDVGVR